MKRRLVSNWIHCCWTICLIVNTTSAQDATQGAAGEGAVHAAIDPQPRGGPWMERHEAINRRVKESDVELVFIGDSITQGWEGRGREVWEKYYGQRSAANLGIGGDRTQHVLWRLDNGNIDGISPKLAVVMIGTNNSGSNTPQEIAEGVTAIVKKLRTKLPETKILLLGIFPRGENDENPQRIVNMKTNEMIADLDDDEMVFYRDIGKHFLEDDGQTLSRDTMPDLLHLTEKSYQTWAAAIEPMVARLLGDEPVAAE